MRKHRLFCCPERVYHRKATGESRDLPKADSEAPGRWFANNDREHDGAAQDSTVPERAMALGPKRLR